LVKKKKKRGRGVCFEGEKKGGGSSAAVACEKKASFNRGDGLASFSKKKKGRPSFQGRGSVGKKHVLTCPFEAGKKKREEGEEDAPLYVGKKKETERRMSGEGRRDVSRAKKRGDGFNFRPGGRNEGEKVPLSRKRLLVSFRSTNQGGKKRRPALSQLYAFRVHKEGPEKWRRREWAL